MFRSIPSVPHNIVMNNLMIKGIAVSYCECGRQKVTILSTGLQS